jgi:hypothetical protein
LVKISPYFPGKTGNFGGDWFAPDCKHRQIQRNPAFAGFFVSGEASRDKGHLSRSDRGFDKFAGSEFGRTTNGSAVVRTPEGPKPGMVSDNPSLCHVSLQQPQGCVNKSHFLLVEQQLLQNVVLE